LFSFLPLPSNLSYHHAQFVPMMAVIKKRKKRYTGWLYSRVPLACVVRHL